MKISFAVLIFTLLISAALTFVAAVHDKPNNNNKVLVPFPTSFEKDPAVVNLPQKVGLPFGDFSQTSESEIKDIVLKFFPMLTSNLTAAVPKDKREFKARLQVELSRWAILENALKFRNQPGDAKFLKVMLPSWVCPACTFVIGKMEDYFNDGVACDAMGDIFGSICAAIPVVGAFAVPECIAVLGWACDKILSWVEKEIYTPAQICNKVFGTDCQ